MATESSRATPACPCSKEAILQLFGKGDIRPLLAPGICVICEKNPIQEVEHVIDTLRTLHTHVPTAITGRKYVCGSCAEELARLIGFAAPGTVAKLQEEAEALRADLKDAKEQIIQLEAIPVEFLKELSKKVAKPAPTKAKPDVGKSADA